MAATPYEKIMTTIDKATDHYLQNAVSTIIGEISGPVFALLARGSLGF